MTAVLPPLSADPFPRSGSGQRGRLDCTTRPHPKKPETAMLKPTADIQEVIIAVEEDGASLTRSVPAPSPFPSFDPRAPSFRLQAPTPPLEDRPATPVSLTVSCPSPTCTSPSPAASPAHVPSSPQSHTSSPTLVRNGSSASTSTSSPVMRSMFPRYDPPVALAQQSCYPRVEVNAAVLAVTRRLDSESSYSPSLNSQHEPPSQRSGLASSNGGVGSGLGLQNIQEPTERPVDYTSISTPVELVEFWALANGQKSSESVNDFTLELSWYVHYDS